MGKGLEIVRWVEEEEFCDSGWATAKSSNTTQYSLLEYEDAGWGEKRLLLVLGCRLPLLCLPPLLFLEHGGGGGGGGGGTIN
jgi:hypothetical protein